MTRPADDLQRVTIHHLAQLWLHGEVDAETYFAEVERRAEIAIEEEIRAARAIRRARHGRP